MGTLAIDFGRTVFTDAEAHAYLKISRAKFYQLVSAKLIRPIKIGTRTVVMGAELERFLQSQAA
jgi:excisionase family DNA binding protein